MVKQTQLSDSDQFDPKVFKESLGSFGTTTKPGGNQLQELQAKVRQGVKHVELHLASTGKGQFGVQDVPDKYGFEQRRTIMQLAKLNEQSLSVHGTFDVTSFSGLGQGGFDDSQRLNTMKEIDETIKFAAETAKSGAVVFHLQGEPLSTDKGELNISKSYLNWLKEQAKTDDKYKKELINLKENYFTANPLNRQFVSDPEKAKDIRNEFKELKTTNPNLYNKYVNEVGNENSAWEKYYQDQVEEKRKLSPDMQPLVVIGDKIAQTNRGQDIINITNLKDKTNFSNSEKEMLNIMGIDLDYLDLTSVQKSQSFFTNGFPQELENKFSQEDFNKLRSKVVITYEDVLKNNNYLQAQADENFHKKLLDFQINMANLQKDDLEQNYIINEEYLKQIRELEKKEKVLTSEIRKAKLENNFEKETQLRRELNGGLSDEDQSELNRLIEKNQSGQLSQTEIERANELQRKGQYSGVQMQKMMIMQNVGQIEYQKLERYDEMKAQINEQVKTLKEQKKDVKAVTDVTFDKNISALGHLGIKALRYQLDLKQKSKIANEKVKEFNEKIETLQKQYDIETNLEKQVQLSDEIQKLKYKQRNWIGVQDYKDIDLINKPLYLAPENMLPGYGSLTSLEEFKGAIRMSQQDFAKKILGDETEYKKLKEEYEQETGLKIITHEDAVKLAKRHIGGTFDNAHAAVWLKHFKRENGESDEHRIDRFNKWLNTQAEEMYKEGIIKHVHFNDTQAKDDDHNLLGSGILDIHDLRQRLRKAGMKEALIVEAGGRGANSNMHLLNAFDIFNPTLTSSSGYKSSQQAPGSSGVSDWVSVQREYTRRPQYSQYGMGYSFRHIPPGQGQPKGDWSGTGFL
ncbi:MAG: hypothetical protein KC550_00505 [Nanoarchaeota archaeon]|nr:hypothetical protein [Nanoarchaeota archaeon]